MDRLWAPWRMRYLKQKKKSGCIFCESRKKPGLRHVFLTGRHSFCLLNIYPYNNGHCMAVPKRHVSRLDLLSEEEALDLFRSIVGAQRLLDKVLRPEGYNIGINVSAAAGAGITGHLHVHIVPRWKGDTNFMPVVHGVKVVSQSLEELLERLRKAAKPC